MKMDSAFTPLAILLGTLIIATVIDGEVKLIIEKFEQRTVSVVASADSNPVWAPAKELAGLILPKCGFAGDPCWPVQEVSLPAAHVGKDGQIIFAPGLTTEQSQEAIRLLRAGGVNLTEIYAGQLNPDTMAVPRQQVQAKN